MTIASAAVGGVAGSLTTRARLRRVRVWAHRAWAPSSGSAPASGAPDPDQSTTPQAGSQGLYVKIVNLSGHDIEATHVWLATAPEIDLITFDPALPARIGPDDTHEVRFPLSGLPEDRELERLVRVRFSSGKIVTSRPSATVPPSGAIARA